VRKSAITAALVIAAAGMAGGCGGGSASSTTSKTERREAPQELPDLPAGWRAHTERSIGFALGVPTGWQVSVHGNRALLRPPDHLVAVTVTASRSPSTFKIPPKRFAEQALGALPGFKVPLEASRPEPFPGTPLDGVFATASGAEASGLRERVTVVVLRRDRLVNYTVAVVENAEQPGSQLDTAVALRMVRTIRDVPPTKQEPRGKGTRSG
jgi:hypothetical protein